MATETQQDAAADGGAVSEVDEFASLLKQNFKPRNETAATEVEKAVNTLVKEALDDSTLIKTDILDTIDEMISKIDTKMTAQMNEIIHHEEFQKLESAWRGLHYCVNNSETGTDLKIKVMNVSKAELEKELRRFPGAKWDQSPLFKKIYEAEFGQLGGQPFGTLVGDFYFDHSPADVRLLRDIGKIAEASCAPFISSISPGLFNMESWSELSNPTDLNSILETPDYA
ncbi:MAG: type VI secretion system contractile sheath large subunit, partial [Pseudomonadota bacterium]